MGGIQDVCLKPFEGCRQVEYEDVAPERPKAHSRNDHGLRQAGPRQHKADLLGVAVEHLARILAPIMEISKPRGKCGTFLCDPST
jgi:hypothetical protein